MKLLNKLYIPLLGLIVCILIFLRASTGQFAGLVINKYFPCIQNPMNSFPCFGIYDIGFMIGAIFIGVIFIGVLVFRLINFYKAPR